MRFSCARLLAVALCVSSVSARAEKSAFNFHLDPAVGTGIDKAIFVSGATLKVDTTLLAALGPVAPQVETFGVSAITRGYLDQGSAFGVGLGARLRLFNDEKGYYFNPGQVYRGNLAGNLWLDAHFTYTSGGLGPGFDVGLGYELSLVEGLSVGPFAKFMLNTAHQLLLFGISFTLGAPERTPDEADYDSDGVVGGADKCPTQPEDKDNFKDEDGCPDPDNDADAVFDIDDKCPDLAGPIQNNGCPDQDRDADGVIDRNDACPSVKGLPENNGCETKPYER